MKKILNKKFLVGFLFIFVFGVIVISSNVLKANAVVGTVDVSVSAGSAHLSYPNSGTTISWSSDADSCTLYGPNGKIGDFNASDSNGTGSLNPGTYTYTVECFKADPPAPVCNSYYTPLVTCFTANTLVTMADGSKKDIQNVKIGDILKGESTDNTVLGFHQPKLEDKKLYSFNGGRYFVTAEHPFKTIDGWKSINPTLTDKENIGITVTELKVGDTLITEDGNVLLKTIDSKNDKVDTQLYNFKLDGDHTYYADGYLVHNKAYCSNIYPEKYCGSGNVCFEGTCHVCPSSYNACPSGYTAYCAGESNLCVENEPCGTPAGSYCSGTVAGSRFPLGVNDGQDCRQYSQSDCGTWLTHGCTWIVQ